MSFINGVNRDEIFFTSFNDFIPSDDDVRFFDSIIDSLDLSSLGYSPSNSSSGRPSYDPKTLLKIFIFGYKNSISSGRKLEKACRFDLRFIWLSKNLHPDANTLNDFRKNNKSLLINAFYELNRKFISLGLLNINNISQDGFKIKASNSKDKNFTVNKVIDRINHNTSTINSLESEINNFKNYIDTLEKEELNENLEDEIESKKNELEQLKKDLDDTKKKKIEHTHIYNKLINSGQSQISLTDPDSKLMRNNGKFDVAYNVQTAVDMKSHITTAFTVDNNPADLNSMTGIAKKIRKEYKTDNIITNTTDKGYNSYDDMAESLLNGVIPQVTPMNKKDKEVSLEIDFQDNKITNKNIKSNKVKDIKKCLKAGVIPECYKDYISEIEVVEKKEKIIEDEEIIETRTPEEIRNTAIEKQTFERDLNTNIVYCPQGEVLSRKASNGKTGTKYCNKLACKNCKNPCTGSLFKEVVFNPNQKTLVPKNCKSEKPRKIKNKKYVKKKKVHLKIKIDQDLIKKRMQTSEHTQGTMKTVDNHSCFNVRGKKMVEADLAIYFMSSNIRRVINIIKEQKIEKYILNNTLNNTIFNKINFFKIKMQNLICIFLFLQEYS